MTPERKAKACQLYRTLHEQSKNLCALDDENLWKLCEYDINAIVNFTKAIERETWQRIIKEMEESGNQKLTGWIAWCKEQAEAAR